MVDKRIHFRAGDAGSSPGCECKKECQEQKKSTNLGKPGVNEREGKKHTECYGGKKEGKHEIERGMGIIRKGKEMHGRKQANG